MGRRMVVVIALATGVIGLSGVAQARELVPFSGAAAPGTILIRTAERHLYYVRNDGTALRYKVAVGRLGKQWFGEARVDGKYVRPAWSPPDEVRRDNPRLPYVIPGGAPNNPMGARAITLDRGQYAIHGTNRPSSIGTYASYGCIRMFNEDIVDLYEQVGVGTRVVVER
ncbi:L,D-transpeptidase [Microvirga sp. 2TAF3]|uniref:L,D-transpeptidase n=1 Tax=Microvirga sp. 2TAF3 TaxID=3233014 RepID=UPI003F9E30EF